MEVYSLLFLLFACIGTSSGQMCSTDRQCHPNMCCYWMWRTCVDRRMVSSFDCPMTAPQGPRMCRSKADCQSHECCRGSFAGSSTGQCVHNALESERCPILGAGDGVAALCNCELGFVCAPPTLSRFSSTSEGVCHNIVTKSCQGHSECPTGKCCKRFGSTTTCVTPPRYQRTCPSLW